jgi:acetylornithine deacetylase/succinyl-diaminopimelate desuccinylase-like protein
VLGELVEPLFSMTLSPTMVTASQKRNVIPAVCDVTVDCRLLPGRTPADAERVVRGILGQGDYELEWVEAHGGTRSPMASPLWDAVSSFVEEVEPGAQALPVCVAGFTDSHWIREAFGAVAYGFFPARAMPYETIARLVHSADERVPVDDLQLGVDWLRYAAERLLV